MSSRRTGFWIVEKGDLVRDYEQLTVVAETPIISAAGVTLVRRWP